MCNLMEGKWNMPVLHQFAAMSHVQQALKKPV
jgi:hypothetical protein